MKNKILLISVAVFVLLAGGGAAAAYFTGAFGSDDEASEAAAAADVRPYLYVELRPLVLSFVEKKKRRYLQISAQVVSRDEQTVTALDANAPMLQAAALKKATAIGAEKLRTNEGRDKLVAEMRDTFPKLRVFENLNSPLEIEDVILTNVIEQ